MRKMKYAVILPIFALSLDASFAKMEVKNATCQYNDRYGYEICSTKDMSKIIEDAAYHAQGSYKLETGMTGVISPAKDSPGWDKVDLLRLKVDYFLENGRADEAGHFGIRDAASGVISIKDDTITVAFHGTQDSADVYTDVQPLLDMIQLKSTLRKLDFLGMSDMCKAHSGFVERYLHDRVDMQRKLKKMMSNHLGAQQLKIVVTGHSLGGALATLAAFDIKKNLYPTVELVLVTFNSPRVFNVAAAQEFETLLGENSYRIWRHYDPVSAVPTGWLGYKHVGKSLKLPYVGYFNVLSNHFMKYTIAEIVSVYTIRPETAHKGWF